LFGSQNANSLLPVFCELISLERKAKKGLGIENRGKRKLFETLNPEFGKRLAQRVREETGF
jgi:hypothetical protein